MHAYTFQTILKGETLRIPSNCGFDGKKVIITIVELPLKNSPKEKHWTKLGMLNLKNSLDQKNIRDIAYTNSFLQ